MHSQIKEVAWLLLKKYLVYAFFGYKKIKCRNATWLLVLVVLGVVEPVAALHEHHEPLQSLRVDAVNGHGVVLQRLLVLEPFLAEGAGHRRAPLLALLILLLRPFLPQLLLRILFLFWNRKYILNILRIFMSKLRIFLRLSWQIMVQISDVNPKIGAHTGTISLIWPV